MRLVCDMKAEGLGHSAARAVKWTQGLSGAERSLVFVGMWSWKLIPNL